MVRTLGLSSILQFELVNCRSLASPNSIQYIHTVRFGKDNIQLLHSRIRNPKNDGAVGYLAVWLASPASSQPGCACLCANFDYKYLQVWISPTSLSPRLACG